MLDLFYLNTDEISVDDFAKIANRLNIHKIEKYTEESIAIFFDEDTRWEVDKFDLKKDIVEPNDLKFLKEKKISTVYCISYHSWQKEKIVFFWKEVLDEFGGLLGNDNDYFEPIYDKDSINSFIKD